MKTSPVLPTQFEDKRPSLWTPRLIIALISASVLVFALGIAVGKGKVSFGAGGLSYDSKSSQQTSGEDKKSLPADLNYQTVEEIYDELKKNYDGELTTDKLLDGMKQGLARATGDPYTEYFNAAEAQEFDDELNGTFVGIGAELGKENDVLTIVSPIPGFPADKAGIRARDVIVEINGEPSYDLSVSEAVKRIRGEKGTKVTLKVVRGGTEQLTFEIIREQITIASVEQKILDGNIGLIKISRYSEDTTELVRNAAMDFREADVKGIILDVRGNPGGLLDSAVDVSSLWLEDKTVLDERRSGATVRTFKSEGAPLLKDIPTIVLINEGSASASEITAGALKDNGAAQLVGVKSYGKGSVQQLVELGGGKLLGKDPIKGVLKVTIARWYTPSGKNIDKEGISPDIEVKLSEDDIINKRDPQQDKALELLRK